MQGSCVGGSSVVSSTIATRAPDYVLESWAKDHGIDALSPNKIYPYYEKVERRLYIHLNEPHEINDCANAIIRGCELGCRDR